jgi:peptidoglycan hydrolase CwlO-like protein
MDKKAHKKLDQLQQRLQKLRNQIAGAKKQNDEPGEVERLTRELAATEQEIKKLKET